LETQYTAHDYAYVAVIDVATDSVEKVIVDERTTSIGYHYTPAVFMDEQNDIYFYSPGMWGFVPNTNDGFLRIRSGQTDWDPGYYFSLKNTPIAGMPGNTGLTTFVTEYGGSGDVYTMIQIRELTSNPPDYVNDRNFQPCKVNVYNQTIEKIDLPPSAGWGSTAIEFKGNDAFFGLVTATGAGLYTYNMISSATSDAPVITTEGTPMLLYYLGD
jgi:hypothetical protein